MVSQSKVRQLVRSLREAGELVEVRCSVDPRLELAHIHRRVVLERGPAILFSNVKGSSFPVVTNLFGSDRRIRIALGEDVESRIEQVINLFLDNTSSGCSRVWKHRRAIQALWTTGITRSTRSAYVDGVDLNRIPFLTCWPEDGGPYLTLPLVYTESPCTHIPNLGMYRIQRYSACETGVHWQVGKGGGFHYQQSEAMNAALPVVIYLGGSPSLLFSAIAPLPENVSELLFASLLQGEKFRYTRSSKTPYPLLADCDVALCGSVQPHERRYEGPFGDHFGYLDPARSFPVFRCEHVLSRPDAIIPATVTGKPLQEDSFIGRWVQKLLTPFLLAVVSGLEDIYSFPETGFHPLVAIRVRERYEHEAFTVSLRVLSEGQLCFTKVLFVVNEKIPLDDIKVLLPYVLERISAQTVYILPNTVNDSLDMTGPRTDSGSKAIFFGLGHPKRTLPHQIPSNVPCAHASVFTPGCLVIDGVDKDENLQTFITHEAFSQWPFVIIVDDAMESTSSALEFLWRVFTRFEPARDIYAKYVQISRNSASFTPPLLIDARMKSSYYGELHPSKETVALVDRRWHEYFSS